MISLNEILLNKDSMDNHNGLFEDLSMVFGYKKITKLIIINSKVMKRKYYSIPILIELVVLVVLLVHCTREPLTGCQVKGERDTPISIDISSSKIGTKMALYNKANEMKVNYQFADASLDKILFEELKSNVNSLINQNLAPYAIVLYCDKYLDDGLVDQSVIFGYSLYSYSDGIIRHKLFQKNNFGQLVENKAYDMQVRTIVTNMLGDILKKEIFPLKTDNKSILLIFNKDKPKIILKNKRDDYLIKTQVSKTLRSFLKEAEPPDEDDCSLPCLFQPDNACFPGSDDPENPLWTCFPRYCPKEESQNAIETGGGMSTDSINIAFDTQLDYDFRDDFLINSEKGQKYIDYYYTIGSYITGEISLPLALKTARTLALFNNVMEIMMDPNAPTNQIVIDSTLKSKLESLIEDYKELSTDQDYIDILDEILSDLDDYSGKTRTEILSMMQ